MNTLNQLPVVLNGQIPTTFDFEAHLRIDEFVDWYRKHEDANQQKLLIDGAILIRGLPIGDVEDFEKVIRGISAVEFANYVDGNSPRTKLSPGIYTSTEYDPDSSITLHNELSYTNNWPSKIYFCCIQPSETGGETPIADCRRVLKAMPKEIKEEVEAKGIKYIRNLNSGMGFGPSWQDTFETENADLVEKYCIEGDIQYKWKDNGGLRLEQLRKGIEVHPKTNEKVWFNQIDQFHPCHLNPEVYNTLMELYDGNESELPMYVTFGDGTEISTEMVDCIRKVIDQESVIFPWQKGDLLVVDNVLVSHGRKPFTGKRKVLVAMSY